jgi:hypothetical protein
VGERAVIPIRLQWLVFACLLVFLCWIFFVWICYEVSRRRREWRAVRDRLRCAVCRMEFADRSGSALATCPGCGSLNERVRGGPH